MHKYIHVRVSIDILGRSITRVTRYMMCVIKCQKRHGLFSSFLCEYENGLKLKRLLIQREESKTVTMCCTYKRTRGHRTSCRTCYYTYYAFLAFIQAESDQLSLNEEINNRDLCFVIFSISLLRVYLYYACKEGSIIY